MAFDLFLLPYFECRIQSAVLSAFPEISDCNMIYRLHILCVSPLNSQLSSGAELLSSGMEQLSSGMEQLSSGMEQLSSDGAVELGWSS